MTSRDQGDHGSDPVAADNDDAARVTRAGNSPPASGSASAEDRQLTWLWRIGLVVWGVEIVVIGFLSLAFGGLSAMLSDTCFAHSTELICNPGWQTVMAMTAITTLLATVLVLVALMAWLRRLVVLGVAYLATPLLPMVAFLIMQEIVTA